jgi:hypothetical protein
MIANLSISDQYDVGELARNDLLSNIRRRSASCSSHADDFLLELLFGGEVALRVPKIVVSDILGVFCDNIADSLPIVLTVPYGTGVIDKECV